MLPSDFEEFGIRCFDQKEIEATGARLADVQVRLVQHLDRFRRALGKPVYLVKNGLTTGKHKSKLHIMGLAVDATARDFEPEDILKAAIHANFNGVGLYFSNGWTSFHLDLRNEIGFWIGYKRKGQRKWRYTRLVSEPV